MSKYTIKNTEGVQINNQLYVGDSLEFTNNDLEGIIDFVGGAGTIVIDSSIATPFAFAIQDELLNDFLTINGTNGYVKVHNLLEYNSDPTVLSGWGNLSVPTKQYVDSLVGGANELSEILANGNTSGANDIYIDNGQKLRTPSIEFDATINSDIITNVTSDVKFEVFSSSAGDTNQYLNMDINNARVNNNIYMDEFETGVNFQDKTFAPTKYAMWVGTGKTFNASNKHAIIGAVKGFTSTTDPVEIYSEENTNTYTTTDTETYPVVISGRNTTVNAGIKNSVMLGGSNGIIDQNNTAFANELRFNSGINESIITDVNSNVIVAINDSYSGLDNTFAVSTNGVPGSDGGAWLWLSGTAGNNANNQYAELGQGSYETEGASALWQTKGQDGNTILYRYTADGNFYFPIIQTKDNRTTDLTSVNTTDAFGVWVGGRNNTFTTGVANSVIVGGNGIQGTNSNTLFTQNFETKSLVLKVDDDNNEVSVYNGEKIRKKTPQTLTSGATITWDMDQGANANLTLGTNGTVDITNVQAGDYGTIVITQDVTGTRTITFGNVNGGAGTHVAVSGGGGAITLTSTGLAVDILSYYYDGTSVHWSAGYDYT